MEVPCTKCPLAETRTKVVFGAGVRFNFPFSPLRIDFTWSARPDENGRWLQATPQFAIGPSF